MSDAAAYVPQVGLYSINPPSAPILKKTINILGRLTSTRLKSTIDLALAVQAEEILQPAGSFRAE